MLYRESRPSPRFASFVKCFWSLEQDASDARDSREPVLPDGCFEIVFNLSDSFRRFNNDGTELQPQTLVAGQMSRGIVIGPSGDVKLFGVRFRPAGAFPFFRFPLYEMTDRIESFDAVCGSGSRELEERIFQAITFEERIKLFETKLDMQFSSISDLDIAISKAAALISGTRGKVQVAELSRSLGWSERKLERRFKEKIGVSPKLFARINRFNSVLRSLEAAGPANMLDHAHAFGYYDQAHMINEFRGFAGKSPIAFLQEKHRLSELFTNGQ